MDCTHTCTQHTLTHLHLGMRTRKRAHAHIRTRRTLRSAIYRCVYIQHKFHSTRCCFFSLPFYIPLGTRLWVWLAQIKLSWWKHLTLHWPRIVWEIVYVCVCVCGCREVLMTRVVLPINLPFLSFSFTRRQHSAPVTCSHGTILTSDDNCSIMYFWLMHSMKTS